MKLTESQINSCVSALNGWQLAADRHSIWQDFKFTNFRQTMAFVNKVADIAETEDHHPDMEIGYNHCLIRYSTHAIAGLSDKDFICAQRIDALNS